MGKKRKDLVKIYEYYYMDGFKVKEIEGEVVSKTVEYIGGEEYLRELNITPIDTHYIDNIDVHTIHISNFNRLITTSECSVPIMFSLFNDEKHLNKFIKECSAYANCEIRNNTQILEDAKQKLEYWENIREELEDKNDKR